MERSSRLVVVMDEERASEAEVDTAGWLSVGGS